MAPGDKARQSQLMMQAASSGHAAVQDARNQVLSQHRAGAQQADQRAGMVGSQLEQSAARQQQQGQFEKNLEQRQSETDLEARKAGFEPNNDRLSKLDQEMQRGADQPSIGPLETDAQDRLRTQGAQPMEQDPGSGRWRPTAERQQQTKANQELGTYKAQTERVRALAYQQQTAANYNKAQLKGETEVADQNYKTLLKPINQQSELFNSFMNDKMTDGQWSKLELDAKDVIGMDPSLGEAIKQVRSGNADAPVGKSGTTAAQRVVQFMRGKMDAMAISHVEMTGRFDGLDVDWTSPKMQTFKEMQNYASGLAASFGPEFSRFCAINSIASKNEFVNRQAAIYTKYGMDQVLKADTSGEGFITGNEAGGLGQPLQDQQGQQEPMGSLGPDMSGQAPQGEVDRMAEMHRNDPQAAMREFRNATGTSVLPNVQMRR